MTNRTAPRSKQAVQPAPKNAEQYGFEVEFREYQSDINNNTRMLGFVSIYFCNHEFCVTGARLMEGEYGRFLNFPSRKTREGDYKDVAFPLNKEIRQAMLDEAIYQMEG